ncbi:MAG: hypothetical protein R6U36_08010 [Candidatus Fermentibacteraceae bacterium]
MTGWWQHSRMTAVRTVPGQAWNSLPARQRAAAALRCAGDATSAALSSWTVSIGAPVTYGPGR